MFQPRTLATPHPSRQPRISRRCLTCAETPCSSSSSSAPPPVSPPPGLPAGDIDPLACSPADPGPARPAPPRAGEREPPGPGLAVPPLRPRGRAAGPAGTCRRSAPHRPAQPPRTAALPAGRCPPFPPHRGPQSRAAAAAAIPAGQERAPQRRAGRRSVSLPVPVAQGAGGAGRGEKEGGGKRKEPHRRSPRSCHAPGLVPRGGGSPKVPDLGSTSGSGGCRVQGPGPAARLRGVIYLRPCEPRTERAALPSRSTGHGTLPPCPPGGRRRTRPSPRAALGRRAHLPGSAARPPVLGKRSPGADRVGRRRARLPTRLRPLPPGRSPRWRTAPRPPPLLGPA